MPKRRTPPSPVARDELPTSSPRRSLELPTCPRRSGTRRWRCYLLRSLNRGAVRSTRERATRRTGAEARTFTQTPPSVPPGGRPSELRKPGRGWHPMQNKKSERKTNQVRPRGFWVSQLNVFFTLASGQVQERF